MPAISLESVLKKNIHMRLQRENSKGSQKQNDSKLKLTIKNIQFYFYTNNLFTYQFHLKLKQKNVFVILLRQ